MQPLTVDSGWVGSSSPPPPGGGGQGAANLAQLPLGGSGPGVASLMDAPFAGEPLGLVAAAGTSAPGTGGADLARSVGRAAPRAGRGAAPTRPGVLAPPLALPEGMFRRIEPRAMRSPVGPPDSGIAPARRWRDVENEALRDGLPSPTFFPGEEHIASDRLQGAGEGALTPGAANTSPVRRRAAMPPATARVDGWSQPEESLPWSTPPERMPALPRGSLDLEAPEPFFSPWRRPLPWPTTGDERPIGSSASRLTPGDAAGEDRAGAPSGPWSRTTSGDPSRQFAIPVGAAEMPRRPGGPPAIFAELAASRLASFSGGASQGALREGSGPLQPPSSGGGGGPSGAIEPPGGSEPPGPPGGDVPSGRGRGSAAELLSGFQTAAEMHRRPGGPPEILQMLGSPEMRGGGARGLREARGGPETAGPVVQPAGSESGGAGAIGPGSGPPGPPGMGGRGAPGAPPDPALSAILSGELGGLPTRGRGRGGGGWLSAGARATAYGGSGVYELGMARRASGDMSAGQFWARVIEEEARQAQYKLAEERRQARRELKRGGAHGRWLQNDYAHAMRKVRHGNEDARAQAYAAANAQAGRAMTQIRNAQQQISAWTGLASVAARGVDFTDGKFRRMSKATRSRILRAAVAGLRKALKAVSSGIKNLQRAIKNALAALPKSNDPKVVAAKASFERAAEKATDAMIYAEKAADALADAKEKLGKGDLDGALEALKWVEYWTDAMNEALAEAAKAFARGMQTVSANVSVVDVPGPPLMNFPGDLGGGQPGAGAQNGDGGCEAGKPCPRDEKQCRECDAQGLACICTWKKKETGGVDGGGDIDPPPVKPPETDPDGDDGGGGENGGGGGNRDITSLDIGGGRPADRQQISPGEDGAVHPDGTEFGLQRGGAARGPARQKREPKPTRKVPKERWVRDRLREIRREFRARFGISERDWREIQARLEPLVAQEYDLTTRVEVGLANASLEGAADDDPRWHSAAGTEVAASALQLAENRVRQILALGRDVRTWTARRGAAYTVDEVETVADLFEWASFVDELRGVDLEEVKTVLARAEASEDSGRQFQIDVWSVVSEQMRLASDPDVWSLVVEGGRFEGDFTSAIGYFPGENDPDEARKAELREGIGAAVGLVMYLRPPQFDWMNEIAAGVVEGVILGGPIGGVTKGLVPGVGRGLGSGVGRGLALGAARTLARGVGAVTRRVPRISALLSRAATRATRAATRSLRRVSGRAITTEGSAGGDAALGIGAATESPASAAVHFTTPAAKVKILAGVEHEGQTLQVLKGRWRTFAFDEAKLPADAAGRLDWAQKFGMVRKSRTGAEILVNATELGPAPARYGPVLKWWFDKGGVVMTRGPGVYEIASGRFIPGMKLAADGASLAPMHLGDQALYWGHEGFLSTIGWGPVVGPPAAAGWVYFKVKDP